MTLVSVCIPTFNSVKTIEETLTSALAQDHANLEVVVVDDGSTDGTVDVLHEFRDERLSIHRNPANLGHNVTWNLTVQRSHGKLVKFLHHDDVLQSGCVSALASTFARHPSVGLAFCRRRIVPADEDLAEEWTEQYLEPHLAFGGLAERNEGLRLLDPWVRSGLSRNWIGEPSCVMVSRSALELVGGFHRHLSQAIDMDLWMRVAARFDVGFVDAELASYRLHANSLTAANRRTHANWLDRLWLMEGLTWDPAIGGMHPEIERWRREALRVATQSALTRADPSRPNRARARDLGTYARFRVQRRLGRATRPFGEIGPLSAPVNAR